MAAAGRLPSPAPAGPRGGSRRGSHACACASRRAAPPAPCQARTYEPPLLVQLHGLRSGVPQVVLAGHGGDGAFAQAAPAAVRRAAQPAPPAMPCQPAVAAVLLYISVAVYGGMHAGAAGAGEQRNGDCGRADAPERPPPPAGGGGCGAGRGSHQPAGRVGENDVRRDRHVTAREKRKKRGIVFHVSMLLTQTPARCQALLIVTARRPRRAPDAQGASQAHLCFCGVRGAARGVAASSSPDLMTARAAMSDGERPRRAEPPLPVAPRVLWSILQGCWLPSVS